MEVTQAKPVKPIRLPDCETIGRLVRRQTLSAVALHFAAMADAQRRQREDFDPENTWGNETS